MTLSPVFVRPTAWMQEVEQRRSSCRGIARVIAHDSAPGLIIHSDRGVQYRAQKYLDFMASKGGVVSMSRKGKIWYIRIH
ncbi:MAG: hypothetical protein OEY09_17590 [Gammaproteobacteria bacterium]|nr:hypothetical protein [Gammaproteobacteria bacterium]